MSYPLLKSENAVIDMMLQLPTEIAKLITTYSRHDWKPAMDAVIRAIPDATFCMGRNTLTGLFDCPYICSRSVKYCAQCQAEGAKGPPSTLEKVWSAIGCRGGRRARHWINIADAWPWRHEQTPDSMWKPSITHSRFRVAYDWEGEWGYHYQYRLIVWKRDPKPYIREQYSI